MLFLSFFLLLGGVDEFNLEASFYNQILKDHFLVTEFGNLFILDPDAKTVSLFNQKGKLVKVISRRGKGPGEILYPNSISFIHNSLILYEPNVASIFDQEGNFIKRFSFFNLQGVRSVFYSPNGWLIHLKKPLQGSIEELLFYDHKIINHKNLFKWKNEETESGYFYKNNVIAINNKYL